MIWIHLWTSKSYAPFRCSYLYQLRRLRLKIRVPYHSLRAHVSRLQKLRQASDILRRTSRFVILARRLQLQMTAMDHTATAEEPAKSARTEAFDVTGLSTSKDSGDEKERIIAKAALSIAELGKHTTRVFHIKLTKASVSLLHGANNENKVGDRNGECAKDSVNSVAGNVNDDSEQDVPLRSIAAVAAHVRFIEEAQTKITHEMETMVLTGLTTLVRHHLVYRVGFSYSTLSTRLESVSARILLTNRI